LIKNFPIFVHAKLLSTFYILKVTTVCVKKKSYNCDKVAEVVSPLPDSWEVTGKVSDTAL
jgi:hypothetical protein